MLPRLIPGKKNRGSLKTFQSVLYLGSFLDPEDIKSVSLGDIGTLVKERGSLESIWGTKDTSVKD